MKIERTTDRITITDKIVLRRMSGSTALPDDPALAAWARAC
jgi:hypothetical protein